MRFTLLLALSAPLLALTSPAPMRQAGSVAQQLAFDGQSAAERVQAFLTDNDDDKCPDLVVRCVKDGDVTKVIGDIGEQGFCKEGLKCVQCHSKKNSLECNAKYLKKCAGKCEGWGSPI